METILLKVKTQGIDYVNNFMFDNGLEGRLGFDFTDCGVDDYEKFAYIRLEDETLLKYSLGTGIRTNIPVRTEFTRSEIIQITPAAEKVVGGKREAHTFGLFTIDTQQVIGSITELDPANIDIIERLLKEFSELLESFGLVESDVIYILERLDNFIQSGKTVEQWTLDFQNYLESKFEEYYDKDEIDDKVNFIFETMNNLITDVYTNMGEQINGVYSYVNNQVSGIYGTIDSNHQQINNRLTDFEQEEYYPFKESVYTKDLVYTKDETDGFLDVKADKDDVYTKTETYTKEEVNAIAFDGDLVDYYTKDETNDKFGLKEFTTHYASANSSIPESYGPNLIPENARQFQSPPWVKYQDAEVSVTPAPMEVFEEGYSRNLVAKGVNSTVGGITITYNDDGSFILNGTCTLSGVTIDLFASNDIQTSNDTTSLVSSVQKTGFQIRVYNEIGSSVNRNVVIGTTTISTEFGISRIALRFNEGNTFNNDVFKIKLEKGENPNPTWTPAWEDLPIEEKPVSFIETGGGTHRLKYRLNVVVPSTEGVVYQFGGKIKNFGDSSINVHSNFNSISDVGVNETVDVNGIAIGNGIVNLQYQFWTQNISDNLSFYAYQPSVQEVYPEQYDDFELGVHDKKYIGIIQDEEPSNAPSDYLWIPREEIEIDLSDYYNKTETDSLLDDKADKDAVYNKSEINGLLDDKVSETDFNQLSSEVSLLEVGMDDKADKNTVYTKTEADGLLDDLISESKTYTDNKTIESKAYTDTMVGDIESLMEAIINGN